jgi:dipeptidyl aminopeptidase/acylaminoacyl peptidase
MRRTRYGLAIGALVLIIGSAAVIAQNKTKLLTNDTFLEMESVGAANISPDGQLILFTRGGVDRMNDRNKSSLLLVDVGGTRVRELTDGGFEVSSPTWSPDGKRIAFLSDRSGANQIHVMWIDTREVVQLTNLEHAPRALTWSPDGQKIAFTSFIPDNDPVLKVADMPSFPKGAKLARPIMVEDRLDWNQDGQGYLPRGFTQIFVVDGTLGGTPTQLTSGKYNYNDPEWSRDGRTLFFSAIRKPDADYLNGDTEIYAINLQTRELKELTNRKGPDNGPVVSPDGRWIAYTGYDEENFYSTLSNLYLMDINGGGKKMLAGNLANSPGDITWAKDNSGIYFLLGEKGSQNLKFVPLSGAVRNITEGVQVLSGVSIANNGQVATVVSTYYKPGDLVTFNLNRPADMKTLVDVNADVLADAKLGEVEEIWVKSSDGLDVQGWLMKPANFEPGKKYPMVLWIHGGPVSMYNIGFNWNYQNFAADGYAVLWTNPRGSTGYGQKFVNGINYLYPGKDFDDLMASVDGAIAKGFIDERNLFVTGSSGGGVLTAWVVGHTNRFRAAVSQRPVINWHSFVGTYDGGNWYRRFRSKPWEDPMEYAERSPLTYVAKVTTPTMMLSGMEDLRTPMSQAEEFYRALKLLKKETLHVKIPDEYHGSRSASHRILTQLYLKAWFEKYRVRNATSENQR